MNLCLDIGNTKIKATWFEGMLLVGSQTFSVGEYIYLSQFCESIQPEVVFICSVSISEIELRKVFQPNCKSIYFNYLTKIPITNSYETPEKLGMDRLAAAIGAWHLAQQKPILSIDAGTCITYDFINKDSSYIGGAIAPGLLMRLKAMHQFTEKLPLIEQVQLSSEVGTNTNSSMMIGAAYGIGFETEGFIKQFSTKNKDLQIYITGGDANILEERLKNSIFALQIQYEKHLVAIGLNVILNHLITNKIEF